MRSYDDEDHQSIFHLLGELWKLHDEVSAKAQGSPPVDVSGVQQKLANVYELRKDLASADELTRRLTSVYEAAKEIRPPSSLIREKYGNERVKDNEMLALLKDSLLSAACSESKVRTLIEYLWQIKSARDVAAHPDEPTPPLDEAQRIWDNSRDAFVKSLHLVKNCFEELLEKGKPAAVRCRRDADDGLRRLAKAFDAKPADKRLWVRAALLLVNAAEVDSLCAWTDRCVSASKFTELTPERRLALSAAFLGLDRTWGLLDDELRSTQEEQSDDERQTNADEAVQEITQKIQLLRQCLHRNLDAGVQHDEDLREACSERARQEFRAAVDSGVKWVSTARLAVLLLPRLFQIGPVGKYHPIRVRRGSSAGSNAEDSQDAIEQIAFERRMKEQKEREEEMEWSKEVLLVLLKLLLKDAPTRASRLFALGVAETYIGSMQSAKGHLMELMKCDSQYAVDRWSNLMLWYMDHGGPDGFTSHGISMGSEGTEVSEYVGWILDTIEQEDAQR